MLSELDKQKIGNYMYLYASSGYHVCGNSAPLDDILKPWRENKQELYKLFGNKLILEYPIKYEKSKDTILYELQDKIHFTLTQDACSSLTDRIVKYNPQITFWRISDLVHSLISYPNLTTNEVKNMSYHLGESYLMTPEGKKMPVPDTARPFRFLQRLIEKFGLEEHHKEKFEQVRLTQSMVLEQKYTTGTLCLSIHPLDYMTMSDNASNWQTCMNWTDCDGAGEYKQGTVEMMNSDCVVVAYLKSDKEDFRFGGEEEDVWNNKKWRQLFVIKPDYIVSVKPYPYENYDLTKTVIATIRDHLGWGDAPIEEFKPFTVNEYDGHCVKLIPSTGAMYNDFNRCQHFICVRPDAPAQIDETLHYSGPSECMCCGKTYYNEWWQERMLMCSECLDVIICDHCGYIMPYGDDAYYFNGNCFCGDCYYEETSEDEVTRERVWTEDIRTIYFSLGKDDYISANGYNKYIETAEKDCDLTEYFTQVRSKPGTWDTTYYVCADDLTDQGMDLFCFGSRSDIDKYIKDNISKYTQGICGIVNDNLCNWKIIGDTELPF